MRILGLYNYWVFIFLMMVGFYILISRRNLVKKILGLNIFQTSVFIFYISMGKITGGTAPILMEGGGGGGLLQSAPPRPHPDGHRGGGLHHGRGPVPGGADQGGVRHHRRG